MANVSDAGIPSTLFEILSILLTFFVSENWTAKIRKL